jgi:pimeloyl-ACP methyl ester carboxylesterase
VYEAYAERLTDARIQDVDAGHLVPMEKPELVVAATLAFVAERHVSIG